LKIDFIICITTSSLCTILEYILDFKKKCGGPVIKLIDLIIVEDMIGELVDIIVDKGSQTGFHELTFT